MVERDITDEEKAMIINSGAFHYSPEKTANILGWPVDRVQEQIFDESGAFYGLYQKGLDLGDYAIDMKLFEMAKAGDLKALTEFEFRKNKRNGKK